MAGSLRATVTDRGKTAELGALLHSRETSEDLQEGHTGSPLSHLPYTNPTFGSSQNRALDISIRRAAGPRQEQFRGDRTQRNERWLDCGSTDSDSDGPTLVSPNRIVIPIESTVRQD